ncbi:hypothetical protein GCM10010347_42560 [Streptomyces cirratus]|uniref:Uncharacterized protein n=1 Tax=Streptomyces cirratus TaxID=68187 RepID=A0ABQ3F0P6_9ACTN|nr:hypothetical protein GCM10010347_42560 [Streptomyces cirratus]
MIRDKHIRSFRKSSARWATTALCGLLAAAALPAAPYHPVTGADLRVEVSRCRAADPRCAAECRGVLMMAAGSPGASGLARPARLASYSPKPAEAYDIVGPSRGCRSRTPGTGSRRWR